jgi:transketolase
MTYTAASGHPGGSMSAAELAAVLYFNVLRVDPRSPRDPDRDRFILSKGHCAPVHYAALARRGFFPVSELVGFRRLGHVLQGHSDIKVAGVDMSAGSLGMGLSFANGCALAARIGGKDFRSFVILGDGELQEGNIWEAAMTTVHRGLANVTAIVDYNKVQIDGPTNDVKNLEPLAEKWRAFGWNVLEIDGHDPAAVEKALEAARVETAMPSLVLAHTIKGKGVSFMEGKAEYHGRALTDDEMRRAFAEFREPFDPASVRQGWAD